MTKKKTTPKEENPADTEQTEVAEDQAPLEGEDLAAALENALVEVAEFKDQTLRAKAETENMRKRVSRDVEKAHKFALEKFTANLLPVVDGLEKAVESFDTAVSDAADDDSAISSIGEGVKLALKMFLDTLERSGIKQVNPEGEPFDPQFHEAMGMLENPDMEPGSVMAVLQKGYTLNDRLVRAAMVMVSKEPSAGKEPSAEPSASAGKEPSASAGKEPSAGAGKEPSASEEKEPSAGEEVKSLQHKQHKIQINRYTIHVQVIKVAKNMALKLEVSARGPIYGT